MSVRKLSEIATVYIPRIIKRHIKQPPISIPIVEDVTERPTHICVRNVVENRCFLIPRGTIQDKA